MSFLFRCVESSRFHLSQDCDSRLLWTLVSVGVFFFFWKFFLAFSSRLSHALFSNVSDDAARQALDWGLMELQEFLEDEELALGVKGEGPGKLTWKKEYKSSGSFHFVLTTMSNEMKPGTM